MESTALNWLWLSVEVVFVLFFDVIYSYACIIIGSKHRTQKYPLHAAVEEEDIWKVMKLLKTVPVDAVNCNGYTALFEASRNPFTKRNKKIIKILLRAGANPMGDSIPFYSPVHNIFKRNDMELMTYVLQFIRDINRPVFFHMNLLDIAVDQNNPKMIRKLINMGADLGRKNLEGMSYLHIVVRRSNPHLIKLFVEAGVDINSREGIAHRTPLHFAALGHSVHCLLEVLECKPDINIKDKFGYTPLNVAAKRGLYGDYNIELLLEYGADPNIPNFEGYTPLHNLVMKFRELPYGKLYWLLQNKADVNFKSKKGRTPLHLAVKRNFKNLSAILLDWGADIYAKNVLGRTTLEMNHPAAETSLFLVEHLVMLKHFRNHEINQQFMQVISSRPPLSKHFQSCEEEIKLLKRKVSNSILSIGEFYWINRRVIGSLRNKNFCVKMAEISYKFDIYGARIFKNFKLARSRRKAEDLAEINLTKIFGHVLPLECITNIIRFLSDEDLERMNEQFQYERNIQEQLDRLKTLLYFFLGISVILLGSCFMYK